MTDDSNNNIPQPDNKPAAPRDPKQADDVWIAMRNGQQPPLQNIWDRNMTPQEFYYLLSRYPYLEICDQEKPYQEPGSRPKFIKSQSGWIIHDFGNVIRTSGCDLPYKELQRLYKTLITDYKEEDDQGEGGQGEGGPQRSGTITGQMVTTAYELILLAQERWGKGQIVSGFYGMQRAAWVAAHRAGFELSGFNPTVEDNVVYNWVAKHSPDTARSIKSSLPSAKR